jgi:hypothetical protein
MGFISYLYNLCLFAYSGVKHVLNISIAWRESYKRQELPTLRVHTGSLPVLDVIHVAPLFVSCVVFICFAYLRPVSCEPNIASVYELFIIDCPFGLP